MKKFFLGNSPSSYDLAALMMRLIFGGILVYHGIDKVLHYDLYLTMSKEIIGLPPKLAFNLVIFSELACSFFVAIGLLTRIAVLVPMFSMAVAWMVAQSNDKFQVKELAFLIWLLSFVVFVLGSGKYSVDYLFWRRKR